MRFRRNATFPSPCTPIPLVSDGGCEELATGKQKTAVSPRGTATVHPFDPTWIARPLFTCLIAAPNILTCVPEAVELPRPRPAFSWGTPHNDGSSPSPYAEPRSWPHAHSTGRVGIMIPFFLCAAGIHCSVFSIPISPYHNRRNRPVTFRAVCAGFFAVFSYKLHKTRISSGQ